MKSALWLATALAFIACVGCAKSDGSKDGSKDNTVVAPAVPKPVAAMQTLVDAFNDRRPQALWTALPAKYQQDIKSLLAQASSQADKKIWNKTFEVLGNVTKLAKEKREFILANPDVTDGLASSPLAGKEGDIAKNWDAAVDLIDTLARSELRTAEGLAKLDPEKFLAETGTRWLEAAVQLGMASGNSDLVDFIHQVKGTKVTLINESANMATVQFEAPGKIPAQVLLKKVDDKWLPETLVDQWNSETQKARASIDKLSLAPADASKVMLALTVVDAAAEQLLEAQTQKEFDSAVQSLKLLAMAQLAPLLAPPMP